MVSFLVFVWGLFVGLIYSLYYLYGKVFFDCYLFVVFFVVLLLVGVLGLFLLVDFVFKMGGVWLSLWGLVLLCIYFVYFVYSVGL